jgi:hypothetical protein
LGLEKGKEVCWKKKKKQQQLSVGVVCRFAQMLVIAVVGLRACLTVFDNDSSSFCLSSNLISLCSVQNWFLFSISEHETW